MGNVTRMAADGAGEASIAVPFKQLSELTSVSEADGRSV